MNEHVITFYAYMAIECEKRHAMVDAYAWLHLFRQEADAAAYHKYH